MSKTIKKYKINIGFITQKMGNKTTIFAGESSLLFTLNETAAYIFNGIKLRWELRKIVSGLVDKYGITPAVAEADIEELTNELLLRDIITPFEDGK